MTKELKNRLFFLQKWKKKYFIKKKENSPRENKNPKKILGSNFKKTQTPKKILNLKKKDFFKTKKITRNHQCKKKNLKSGYLEGAKKMGFLYSIKCYRGKNPCSTTFHKFVNF